MKELGYDQYGAHGGDWGSSVVEQLARGHARHLVGIHLTDVPFSHAFQKPDDLTDPEISWSAFSSRHRSMAH
jgi:hypothetical protein